AFLQLVVHRLDHRQAADARAVVDADALGVARGDLEGAVAPGLQARRHAVMDEEVHAPRFLRRHVRRDVEVLHLARDLAREARRIEARDARDAAPARARGCPRLRHAVADGTDDAETGKDDSATAHFKGGGVRTWRAP